MPKLVFLAALLAAVLGSAALPRDAAAAWSILQSTTLGSARGASFADVDGDGDPDLYVAVAFGGGSRLFRNDGGVFAEWAPTGFAPGNTFAGVWGDADEDGDLDLYVTKSSAANVFFRNDGVAGFANATNGLPLGIAGGSLSPAWRDVDRDGDLDLYVARNGADRLLRNDRELAFVDATPAALDDAANTRTGTWGDFDGDGDDDLYVVNTGDPNRLLRNDDTHPGASFAFADVTAPPLDDAGEGRGAAWDDLDGDGDLDLYVTNFPGSNVLLRNDGAGGFADATTGPLGDPSNSQSVVSEDFDRDGDLDLYVVNDGNANRLLRNDGGLAFTDVASGPEADAGTGIGGAGADVDGDGDLDLFVANSGVPSVFLRNEEASGRTFLAVDLDGGPSNRFGIGARVRLHAGGAAQLRHVSAGSGSLSQSTSTLGFGLGEAAAVDSVVVDWPSGSHQVVEAPPAGVRITVVEAPGTPLHAVPAAHRWTGARLVVHPLPSSGRVTLRFEGPDAISARSLVVVDAAGRVAVRLATPPVWAPGTALVWDGRLANGAPAPAGVYFARLHDGADADAAGSPGASCASDVPLSARILLLR